MVRSGFESRTADWLGVDEALARILGEASPLAPERAPLHECLGRALAEDVIAEATLPPWDNSAMDGFAVRGEDVTGAGAEAPVRLDVIGRVRAGERSERAIGPGQAMRIMTGAPLPSGADAVVRVEDTDAEAEPGVVVVRSDRDVGQNVRPAGQDMRRGERLLPRGHRVTPGTIGVLAAAGRADAPVHRRPTVAVLTTGDELRGPDRYEDVRAGRGIPDSNGPMIAALVSAVAGRPLLLSPAEDQPEALRARIAEAEAADLLITVGGASMGEADLVKRVLDELGYRSGFWRVRMRPGSPVGFGWLPRGARLQPVLSLPGNPTSAFVTFEVLARPLLLRLGGHERTSRRRVTARAAEPIRAPARLTYYLRVSLDDTQDGLCARLTGPQGSGLVSGLARAGGLAVIGEDVAGVAEGDAVTVLLLSEA
ncbi:MAG TPA: gephyrin-like molybdotransferase Glp [Longimicrobiales bacterium]|nr:gephyrin-like molybdotransferase Glp [Longimicrobiales bacterium]